MNKTPNSAGLWKNDSKLARIVQNVPIINQDSILREVLKNHSDNILIKYANQIAKKRLISAKNHGVQFNDGESIYAPSKLVYEDREYLVKVFFDHIFDKDKRSAHDRLINSLLQEINYSRNMGILLFLPYTSNSNSTLNYIKKEIPPIAFIDLKYNPKQILQRAYLLK